jgi:hypothetical protein
MPLVVGYVWDGSGLVTGPFTQVVSAAEHQEVGADRQLWTDSGPPCKDMADRLTLGVSCKLVP